MLQLKIGNMTCRHCIEIVRKAILHWQADAKVEVDLTTQLVTIDSKLVKEDILAALDKAGYPAKTAGSCCSTQLKCHCNS
jgi:copper chaperone